MTPESEIYLAKADKLLGDADMMIDIGLLEATGRTAYLAAFHAAQALIFECTGKVTRRTMV